MEWILLKTIIDETVEKRRTSQLSFCNITQFCKI